MSRWIIADGLGPRRTVEGGNGIDGCDEWMILLLGPFADLGTFRFFSFAPRVLFRREFPLFYGHLMNYLHLHGKYDYTKLLREHNEIELRNAESDRMAS